MDIFTGEQEREIAEAIVALKEARDSLPATQDAIKAQLQAQIDDLSRTLAEEDPTPLLCDNCNDPADLPQRYCPQCHNEVDDVGVATQLNYLPLELSI